MMDLRAWIREVDDYPEPGISFKDLTPLLSHPPAYRYAVDWFSEQVSGFGAGVIAAVDARGFLFASPVSYKLGLPLMLLRKSGKLPPEVTSVEYDLEYGEPAAMDARVDGICSGRRVVIIDDLLATGGTGAAAMRLVETLGGEVVAQIFLVELAYLPGRARLSEATSSECEVISYVVYE